MESRTTDLLSPKLTAVDIRNKQFKKGVMGYSPQEVAEFLDLTAKTFERFQRTEKELQDRLKSVGEELTRWKHRELEMVKLKEKAVQEAEHIRTEAQNEAQKLFKEVEERANGIREKTEEWLANVISKVEETERQKNNFMTAFKSALDSHYELLRNEQEDAAPLGDQLNHFLRKSTSSPNLSGN